MVVFLTITTTHRPATDLGFLLHKHPDKVQRFDQSYGTAHVFYPESGEDRCTAALLLDIEPRRLMRARASRSSPDFALAQYVNDRPYAASSLFAVALGDVFGTALKARSADRPELASSEIPLTLSLPAVPARGGPEQAHRLFEPLGWQVRAEPVQLDPELPDWGDSHYLSLTLTGERRLADALSHLYVLLPVLDGSKHYWVGDDEVDKLVRSGEGWLAAHPERGYILRRYLARRGRLFRAAIARLAEVEEAPETSGPQEAPVSEAEEGTAGNEAADGKPAGSERAPKLSEVRIGAVLSVLRAEGVRRVIDLGCGEGKLVGRLLDDADFEQVTGVDVSATAVEEAQRRLRLDRMAERQRRRLELFQGSVVYRDDRFSGFDAAVLMEVVEHVDLPRLPALERVVFGYACPRVVVVTTPNAEYNVLYERMRAGAMRNADHRFEWPRPEFRAWAGGVAQQYGYQVRYLPVGPEDPELGSATQMGVFTR